MQSLTRYVTGKVKMKILILAKAYPPETGGIETYSEELAKSYSDLGHDVTVLTAHPGKNGAESREGVTLYNVGQGPQIKVFASMVAWLRRDRETHYDFVHATTWRVAIPSLIVRPAISLVITIHGREIFVVPFFLKPVMIWALRRAGSIPTVSHPILEKATRETGLSLPQAFSNWNGTSIGIGEVVEEDKPSGFNIFCMCRMVGRKNVSLAITAVAELIEEGLDINFDIAGDGEDFCNLKKQMESCGAGGKISMHGRISDDDVLKYYKKAHVFLHPQIAERDGGDIEGFGIAIADGMVFGCVPIAGASGGPSDFIKNGENGFLVEGRCVDEVKECLRRLYFNPKLLRDMSKKARQFALTNLTWEKHASAILERQCGVTVSAESTSV